MKEHATTTYDAWVKRLVIKPPTESELEKGKWSRVDARAASMIMAALDVTVSSEMVARRLTQSSPGLVFRLLTLYQPGGEQEKGLVLQNLQAPAPADSASAAVEALRAWGSERHHQPHQAGSHHLVRGLSLIVGNVLSKKYQANFRTRLVRSTLKIDTAPTYDTVENFHRHLLAEMEGLATGTATSETRPPSVKEMRTTRGGDASTPTSPTTSPTSATSEDPDKLAKRATTQCRYFGRTQKGCSRGARCPFQHSWEGLEQRERCLAGGGKGHFAKECPTKKGAPKPPNPKTSATTTTTTSAPTTPSARTARVDETKNQIQIVELPVASAPSASTASCPASGLRDVLNEAGKMLKVLSAH